MDRNTQRKNKNTTQQLELTGKDGEIQPEGDRMRAPPEYGTHKKRALKKEIRYLNDILNISRGMNNWLKKQHGDLTQNTKEEITKLYFSIKKAAEKKNSF